MTKDCLPWILIAKDVLGKKWDKYLDESTIESITIGLQSVNDPDCKKALLYLDEHKKKEPKKREEVKRPDHLLRLP